MLSLVQSYFISWGLETVEVGGAPVVFHPGWEFRLMSMITLTSGTAFIMWLGEQITERGIGNGISLIIFAGIIIRIPAAIGQLFQLIRTDQFSILQTVLLLAVAVAVIFGVVMVERAQRRIPIQHARRVVGKRVMQGGMSYFPLRVNTAGVIPAIFASSLLVFPLTFLAFISNTVAASRYLNPVLPFAALLAGYAVARLTEGLSASSRRGPRWGSRFPCGSRARTFRPCAGSPRR